MSIINSLGISVRLDIVHMLTLYTRHIHHFASCFVHGLCGYIRMLYIWSIHTDSRILISQLFPLDVSNEPFFCLNPPCSLLPHYFIARFLPPAILPPAPLSMSNNYISHPTLILCSIVSKATLSFKCTKWSLPLSSFLSSCSCNFLVFCY